MRLLFKTTSNKPKNPRDKDETTCGFYSLCLLCLMLISGNLLAESAVTLNLKDADIRTLIETIADATGKNFVVDPRVKAKVTVVSSRPMQQDELYQVFLSVLQVHGYAAVPVGEVIKILPDVNAKQGPTDVTNDSRPGQGDELVTRVIDVKNVPAAQMVPILRPLIPQQGHLAAYASSNQLVISDRAGNIDRIEQIVRRIDKPDSQQVEVIPLEHASASEVVRIITALNQQSGQAAAAAGGGAPGTPVLAADDRSNSVLLGGNNDNRLRVRALIAHLDTPTLGGGNAQVIFLNYSDAEELAPILLGISQNQAEAEDAAAGGGAPAAAGGGVAGGGGGAEGIDIQADIGNNALIVTAPPDRFQAIKQIVQQLDIRRAQVLVESIIADVSLDVQKDLGVQFGIVPSDGNGPAIANQLPGGGPSLADVITNPLAVGTGFFLGAADIRAGGTNFAFLLRALATDAATNILATPTLVTLDNEEAEIVVAQNVPFITGQFTNTGAAAGAVSPFQTIERQDVGITLRITPQINEGDSIRLDLEQEASSIAPSVDGATDIITNERTISTSVLVDDGQVLVLGGLIQDSFTDTVQKTPILGDLPLIGNLFRATTTNKSKQNLMVFIHPVILRDAASAAGITNEKYSFLRARQLEAKISKRGLIHDAGGDLPELHTLITQIPEINGSSVDELITQDPISEAPNFYAPKPVSNNSLK